MLLSFYVLSTIFFQYLTDKAKREKINQIIECQEGIAMASETLAAFTKDEIEYYHQISKEKYELDMQSMKSYERQQARQQESEKWQGVVADKDAEIVSKDIEIARLKAELEKHKTK